MRHLLIIALCLLPVGALANDQTYFQVRVLAVASDSSPRLPNESGVGRGTLSVSKSVVLDCRGVRTAMLGETKDTVFMVIKLTKAASARYSKTTAEMAAKHLDDLTTKWLAFVIDGVVEEAHLIDKPDSSGVIILTPSMQFEKMEEAVKRMNAFRGR